MLLPVGKRGARLDLFAAQPDGSSVPLTVWHAAKAGLAVADSKVTAADTSGDGRDELLVLAPLAVAVPKSSFSLQCLDRQRASTWKTGQAPFAVKGAQLAATDLNGDGKVDIIIFSHSGGKGHLYGLISSGSRLSLALRWQGKAKAATRLAGGPLAGSAKGAAFPTQPTSTARAMLLRLTQDKHSFAASRVWSGRLALNGAQLACTDLNLDGAGDLLVLAGKGHTIDLTALLAGTTGYRASACWKASDLTAGSLRLASAPSGTRVLAPATTVLQGSATANLVVSADQTVLSFTGAAPAGLAVGKVLLIEPCSAAPDGLLRQVTALTSAGRHDHRDHDPGFARSGLPVTRPLALAAAQRRRPQRCPTRTRRAPAGKQPRLWASRPRRLDSRCRPSPWASMRASTACR